MAALVQTTETKGFQNWLRGALAGLFAKQGLQSFVVDELTQFQRDLLTSIFKNNNLPTGTRVCTNCTTENVLYCRTRNFCTKGQKCKLHDPSVPDKTPKPCPNNICHAVTDAIHREHRYNGPSWKNTNAKGWCTDVTEIAKCYMPDGYTNVTTIADTDFNGLLAVILNNKRFKSKMAALLKSPDNVCTEARDVSRDIRHSANFTISDTDLAKYIDILIRLLSDPAYLAADQDAKTAVNKLNQLKSNTLTITTADIITVLDSKSKYVIQKQRDSVRDISEERRKAKEDIEDNKKQFLDNVKASLSHMHAVTTSNLDKIIESSKQSALTEIQAIAENKRIEITVLSRREKQQIKDAAEKEKDEYNRVVHKAKQELTAICSQEGKQLKEAIRKETVSCPSQLSELIITEDRQKELENGLREDLLSYYRQNYSTIPIAPLVEEHDVELVDFYVQPPLTAIYIEKTFGQFLDTAARTEVHSYRDLFLGSDDKPHKNIYVAAKAGIGKTSFVKKICMTWCQAHSPLEKIKQKFKPDDVYVMKRFDYLFVISLRDTSTSICDIDSMIYSQIIENLAGSHRYSEYIVKEILLHSTCLIILDGLDEWSHPASCRKDCPNVHEIQIPHRPSRERCSILTTTRPWKLDVAKLCTNQIDRHVEINELDTSSSDQLISNALSVLNKRNLQNQPKTCKEFNAAATGSLQIETIRYIPYVLLQMVCLWFDGKPIGKSKCEIYSNVIDFTLTRSLKKCGDYVSCLDGNDAEIPFCLTSKECCKTFYSELLRLGEIAFQTLFKEESSLVFDKTLIRNFVSEQMLGFYLKVGLLSQNKAYGHVAIRQSSFSFQHKAVQEYFAALYIQVIFDSKDKQRIYNKCNTLAAILQMSNVFTFLGGLKPEACAEILQSLQDTISTDRTACIYRNTIHKYAVFEGVDCSYTMKTLQSMYTDIVNEIYNNGLKYVPPFLEDILLDSAIDEKTYPLLELLIERNRFNIKSLCITECQTTGEFTKILNSLGLQKHNVGSLHKLEVKAIPEQPELIPLLSGSVRTLTSLSLSFLRFESHLYNVVNTCISTETMKTILSMDRLISLEFVGVCLSHFDIEALFGFITKQTTMTEISLKGIKCSDSKAECMSYCLDLSKHKKLEMLHLDDIVVSNLRVDTSSLKTCWIGQLPVDVYSSLVKDLKRATCLRTMFIILTEGLLTNFIDTLPKLENLRHLFIYKSNLGDKSLIVPIKMTRIDEVCFFNFTMTSTALRKLIASIEMLPQSVTIEMLACTVIQQEEYEQIKDEIKASPQYKVTYDGFHKDKIYRFAFQTVGQNLPQ